MLSPIARRRLLKAVIAVVACLVAAQLEVAIKCARPSGVSGVRSEACVWGEAYLPLARALYVLIVGPIVYAVLTAIEHRWRRTGGASDD